MTDQFKQALSLIMTITDEKDLIDLHNACADRVNNLRAKKCADMKDQFTIGQEVEWEDKNGRTHKGNVTRRNKKSLSIIEETFGRTVNWKVSYQYARPYNR